MYRTCLHIKPNGLRCESPALKETYFCYFHSKLHSLGAEPHDKYGPMRLPTPEGPAAIQLSIAKITDALINGRMDLNSARQLLYAMQIASQNLEVAPPLTTRSTGGIVDHYPRRRGTRPQRIRLWR